MERVPPCLDPELSKDQRLNRELIGQRYFEATKKIGINTYDLAHTLPLQVQFFPSDEVVRKLVNRSLQIENIYSDLWEGFRPLFKKDGTESWVPKKLLLM